ncbi:MAG: Rieske (2Fe-2S) protein [Xanthomonadales bacterium]|nr:Rieske (2Fe-2S) protein [Xanthomonadales bacterium]
MSGDRICALEEIPGEGAKEVFAEVNGTRQSLIVMRRERTVFVYLNVCPHAGRPLNWAPDQFLFTPQGRLVCAAHGATFIVETGEAVGGPCLGSRLIDIPVAVRDGVVYAIEPDARDA